MPASELRTIVRSLIESACRSGTLDWSVLAEWEDQWTNYEQKLPLLEAKVREMEDLLQKLVEPPLQYATFLKPSPGEERDIVVGMGSALLEVHLTDSAQDYGDSLVAGQQVVLNREQNVVAVRGISAGGETAEVVNILKPDQAAEVLEVIEATSQAPQAVRVRWRDGEEIRLDCSPDLNQQPLKRGDIVQVDPDQQMAVARVRPRLHVRAGGTEGIVVEISDLLFEQGVQIGDIVRVESGMRFAFEKLPSYETGGLTLEDIPDISYEDIGGLEGQIEQVYDEIELPYLYRTQFEEYQLKRSKGLLLYGPPGCGKTMIAKAVANSLTRSIRDHLSSLEKKIVRYNRLKQDGQTGDDGETLEQLEEFLHHHRVDLDALGKELDTIRAVLATRDGVRGFFLNVKGPELLDKYVGETEHRIRKIFEEARRYATFYTPVVIFFDEMESMFRTRGSGRSSDVETTIVPQFLAELDGVEASENLIIIGASNRADLIDPAIMRPGRLDIKVKVDRPSREAALDIFALYLLPTLPLHHEGVTMLDGMGKIIFRTAYRRPDDLMQRDLRPAAARLPEGCDFRLARALGPDDLETLTALPPRMLVREALAEMDGESRLAKTLRRFKSGLAVGEIVTRLTALCQIIEDAPTLLDEPIRREWVAEAMIFDVIQVLYSPSSIMNVLTNSGNRYTFYARDFISGAVIANVVARAKKRAVKRVVLGLSNTGIGLDDLREAIRQEFEENKDQLAQNKLYAELGLSEQIKFVELILQTGQLDPWNEEKLRPYES